MKWTKLEYGEWPEGEIVLRINSHSKIDYAHGYIRMLNDNEFYLLDNDGPNNKLTIEAIYDLDLHYISLNEIPMPEGEDE
jgi:hypothetical protein